MAGGVPNDHVGQLTFYPIPSDLIKIELLTLQLLRYFATRHLLGGGGVNPRVAEEHKVAPLYVLWNTSET